MNAYADAKSFTPLRPRVDPDARTTPVPTDEERARVRAKLGAFRLQSAAFRRPADALPPAEMTPERREYLQKLLALPDRSAVTAEEMQHRRKAQMDLTNSEAVQ